MNLPLVRATVGLLFASVFVLGCGDGGPKRYAVSGTVTFNNAPVPSGAIRFIPEDATKLTDGGSVITDGKFTIPAAMGLMAGKYKVTVSMPDPKVKVVQEDVPGSGPVAKEMIPEKYNSDTKTVLTAEVKSSGENVFPFDLK